MIELKKLRTELKDKLCKNGMNDADADLSLILMDVLKINKTQLVMGERKITDAEMEEIFLKTDRLIDGEPVRYITGKTEFMSLEFSVKSGVLIPRADTETLVESVIKRLDKDKKISVADFCCGSGCIGISLAYYMKNADVTAIDISEIAISVTKENAEKNGVTDRVEVKRLDIMNEMPEKVFDCIMSNPPYIESETIDTLDASVREREPRLALDGGVDGLDFYKRIASDARLKEGGLLALEIGYNQGESVREILAQNGYRDIELVCDIEGRDRVLLARR